MNKTQKAAWFCLTMTVLLFTMVVTTAVVGKIPRSLSWFWFLLTYGIMGLSLVFLRKKQSLAEVESDERDNSIIKRAILVSFVSVWIMLAAVCIIPRFIVGYTGSIAIWVLSLINFAIFLIAMFIYSVAVLVQYGRKSKGEKS